MSKQYLQTFFAEKNLPFASWEIAAKDGTVHFIDNEVVIEHIMIAPKEEVERISKTIRILDFKNADVNNYLKFLAEALVNNY